MSSASNVAPKITAAEAFLFVLITSQFDLCVCPNFLYKNNLRFDRNCAQPSKKTTQHHQQQTLAVLSLYLSHNVDWLRAAKKI